MQGPAWCHVDSVLRPELPGFYVARAARLSELAKVHELEAYLPLALATLVLEKRRCHHQSILFVAASTAIEGTCAAIREIQGVIVSI